MKIQSDVALYFARQFRAARAQVQGDAIAVEQIGAALGAKDGMCAAAQATVNHLFPLSKDSKIDWTHGDNGSPVARTTVFL